MGERPPRRAMARPLVLAEDVHKAYAGRSLLDGASFAVEPGERVALVGPNGSGKSTLLRMALGAERPDAGHLSLAPRLRVVSFEQHPRVRKGDTLRALLSAGGDVPAEMAAELAALEARLADPALYESPEADEVVARYGDVQREVAKARAAAAPDPESNPLLEELGFAPEDLDREASTLSGGELTRAMLARALAQARPDGLLVLDEPTNHLDVETIEWLEDWLLAYGGTTLMVAHDRAFLDNVATRVLAIHGGRVESHPGNYSEYERRREEDRERLLQQRQREERELARQKAVIEQFRHQKRFDGQMASRLLRMEKYRAAVDRTPDPLVEKVRLSVGFPASHKSSQDVLRVRGLGKKIGERVLFYDLSLDLAKGEKVALVGANGVGKTTLLRILVGRERKEVGTVEVAPGVKGAYYAQGNEGLVPERALRDEVLAARPGLEDDDVRALLGKFGFRDPQDARRKVQTLSGGERARLAILKTVLAPSNLLILDEPTNHLDIESRKALAGALNAYDGALLVVSHDRWFLDSVVDKVAVLARRHVKVFAGDIADARTSAAMEAFGVEKPTRYVVRKAFKDFDTGARHTVGSVVELTPAELEAKRLYRTALAMGWMAEE